MPRTRTFKFGILNVVLHPHTETAYASLLQKAFDLKRIIPLDGDRRAYLGSCIPFSSNPADGFEGNIYRFTQINQDQPWLNMLTGNEADPDEVEADVAIPQHLKPNFSAIRYNFFPKKHKLVFEIARRDPTTNKPTNFSPAMAEKFFDRLFSDNSLRTEFADFEITIEQSSETLEEIFSIFHLRDLKILIKKPNPNDGDIEEEIERQLEEENVDSLEQTLKSKDSNEGLKPSQRTKVYAKVALSNGFVFGSGYDEEGDKKEFKTANKPQIYNGEFEPESGVGYGGAFAAHARRTIDLPPQE